MLPATNRVPNLANRRGLQHRAGRGGDRKEPVRLDSRPGRPGAAAWARYGRTPAPLRAAPAASGTLAAAGSPAAAPGRTRRGRSAAAAPGRRPQGPASRPVAARPPWRRAPLNAAGRGRAPAGRAPDRTVSPAARRCRRRGGAPRRRHPRRTSMSGRCRWRRPAPWGRPVRPGRGYWLALLGGRGRLAQRANLAGFEPLAGHGLLVVEQIRSPAGAG